MNKNEQHFQYQHQLAAMHINDMYKHVAFLYGLPGTGKSTKLAKIQKYDKGRDLCLSLRKSQMISGIKYTRSYIRLHYGNNIGAYPITKNSRFEWQRDLRLYAYEHPVIPRILIDECQVFSIKKLNALIADICNIFQHADVGDLGNGVDQAKTRRDPYIVLAGIIYDSHNRMYPVSNYLLHQPQCHCVESSVQCKFCNRPAQYMLPTIHGKKVTFDQLDKLPHEKAKRIAHYIFKHHTRYYVCPYHFVHPPMPEVKNPLIEF